MVKKKTDPKPAKSIGAESPDAKVNQYLKHVNELFETVTDWVKEWDPKARFKRIPTDITEKIPGTYPVKILEIGLPNHRPVRLNPLGYYFAGSEGRVDIESPLGRETLIYRPEAPAMTVRIIDAAGQPVKKTQTQRLHKENVPGWVWVQNRLMGLYPTVNDDLIHRMIEVLGR